MAGRYRLVLISIGMLVLCILLQSPSPPSQLVPHAETSDADANTPIVAIRGGALAEHEEPLPEGARVRFGSTRFRHPREIGNDTVVEARDYWITKQNRRLVLTDKRTGRRVWTEAGEVDAESGWGIYFLLSGSFQFPCVVSPNGCRIVTWDPNYNGQAVTSVRIWELSIDAAQPISAGAVLDRVDGKFPAFHRVLFTPSGNELILVGETDLHVYDPGTGRLLRRLHSETAILDVAPDARRFLTTNEKDPREKFGFVSISGVYSIRTFRFRQPSGDSERRTHSDRDDRLEMSFYKPGETKPGQPFSAFELIIRDLDNGQVVSMIPAPRNPGATVEHFQISPDGRFVSAEFNGGVLVWETNSGRKVLDCKCKPDPDGRWNRIVDVSFSSDSRRFTIRERCGWEQEFDLSTGKESATRFKKPSPWGYWRSADESHEIVENGILRRRDSPGMSEPAPSGYAGVLVDCSPDGRTIAIGDRTGRVDVWTSTGRLVRAISSNRKCISAIAFSPDGKLLAACDKNRVLDIWDVRSWRLRDRVEIPTDHEDLYPEHLTFTPDSRNLLISRGHIMALWNLESREWVWDCDGELHEGWSELAPVLSPNGKQLICLGSGHCQSDVIETATGKTLRVLDQPVRDGVHSGVIAMDWSPDGKCLAAIHDSGPIRIQDVETGKCVRDFIESDGVRSRSGLLRFSPDGRRLVTCDDRGRAHVWEIASGQLAFTLNYAEGDIANVFFGRNGLSLITSNHREVIVWDLKPERPFADLWNSLGHDAPEAEQARRALLADPVAAVELLRTHLRPAKAIDVAEVRRLVGTLDDKDFRVRERAVARLIAGGRSVLPYLKEAKVESDEGTARLAVVTRTLERGLTANELRELRGIEVLEQIKSPAAQALIDRLATGDAGAVLTVEAMKTATRTVRTKHSNALPKSSVSRSATTHVPVPTGGWSSTVTGKN